LLICAISNPFSSWHKSCFCKISLVMYFLKLLIVAWLLIMNWWIEHFLLILNGTHTNDLVINFISGIGKLIFMKGSKVIERWLQSGSGHLTVLLNYPCIKSTIIDWDRLRWAYHDSRLAFSSFSPCDSIMGTNGFILMRFKSSWRLSSMILRSSYESYCS